MGARAIGRRAAIAALTCGLLLGGLAGAASAAAPGGITQLAGAAGCHNRFEVGCTTYGFGSPFGLNSGSPGIAISPDGRSLYAGLTGDDTIVVFDRAPATGVLTQKAGAAGCLTGDPVNARCTLVSRIDGPSAIAVSRDGKSVYVANQFNDTVLAFDRAAGGSLSLKNGGAGCVMNDAEAPCRDGRALTSVFELLLSPDGRHLYTLGGSGSISGFSVGTEGGLTQIENGSGGSGCVQNNPDGTENCGDGRALNLAYDLAIDPEGATLYAAGREGTLSALSRVEATGRLSPVAGAEGCAVTAPADGCGSADLAAWQPGVASGSPLAVTPGEVYFVSAPNNRVLTFNRRPSGGIVRRPGVAGCVSQEAGVADCVPGRGLSGPRSAVVTSDGEDVYVASALNNSAVVELDRAVNGRLTPRGDTRGCLTASPVLNCGRLSGHSSAEGAMRLVVSPDGRFVYEIGATGTVTVLKRDSAGPVCGHSNVVVKAGSVTRLQVPCGDVDGNPIQIAIESPPTLGSTGAIDHNARTIVYAAPQGQGGTTTFSFRASYEGFVSGVGTISVTVTAPPPPPPTGGGGGGGGSTVLPSGVDADGDGFFAGQDCHDGDRAIHPGAREIQGNRIDENCDGLAAAFPTLGAGVVTQWNVRGRTLTLRSLRVTQDFPSGWKAQIRCSGRSCPFRVKSLRAGKVRRGASSVIGSLKARQRRFRAGQTLEVWVSAPGYNTKVARYVLRRGRVPTTQPMCVPAGETRPKRSCA